MLIVSIKDYVVQRFMELCEDKGITLNELANLSGVTPSTVYSMMQNNRREIGITTIKKLCDGLNITICNFFCTDEFKNLPQEIE